MKWRGQTETDHPKEQQILWRSVFEENKTAFRSNSLFNRLMKMQTSRCGGFNCFVYGQNERLSRNIRRGSSEMRSEASNRSISAEACGYERLHAPPLGGGGASE